MARDKRLDGKMVKGSLFVNTNDVPMFRKEPPPQIEIVAAPIVATDSPLFEIGRIHGRLGRIERMCLAMLQAWGISIPTE